MLVNNWGTFCVLQSGSVNRTTQAFVNMDDDLFCHNFGKLTQSSRWIFDVSKNLYSPIIKFYLLNFFFKESK